MTSRIAFVGNQLAHLTYSQLNMIATALETFADEVSEEPEQFPLYSADDVRAAMRQILEHAADRGHEI